MLNQITHFISAISIFFLLFGGVFFSIKLKWIQLHFVKLLKSLVKNKTSLKDTFNSISLSLAARIGVGSLSGVSIAIYYGGPGSLFWIWIFGLITSINTYCETYLSVKYQIQEQKQIKGGPTLYLLKAFKKKYISKIYAFLVVITYIFGFITIQSNTIVVSINNYCGAKKFFVAFILVALTYFSIIKGLKRVSKISSLIVPFMGILYLFLFLYVLINNYYNFPFILNNIILDAFNIKSIGSGFLGTFLIGVQRAVFCTESGLGTGAIASSTVYSNDKIQYSKSQIMGIYYTIFIICTSTAAIILTSNYQSLTLNKINGIELLQYAINYHFGSVGNILLIIIVLCLAYSTIVAGYYYGETNAIFITNESKKTTKIVVIITLLSVIIGSFIKSNILWKIIDFFISILAIINMSALFKLKNEIVNNYQKE